MSDANSNTLEGLWSLLTGLNVVTVLALFVNFGLIFSNFVFTFAQLPVALIPYYDVGLGGWQTHRFYFEWWEIGTDVLRISYPLLVLNVLATQKLFGKHSVIGSLIAVVSLGVLDVAKLVWRVVQWGFCDNHQHCRGYTSPNSINYVFATHIGITFYFVLLAIAYGFIISEIGKAADKNKPMLVYTLNPKATSSESTSEFEPLRPRGGGGGGVGNNYHNRPAHTQLRVKYGDSSNKSLFSRNQ